MGWLVFKRWNRIENSRVYYIYLGYDRVYEISVLVIKRCVLDYKIKILKIKAVGLDLFIM